MNQSWGYNASDDNYKSPEEIIHALVGAAGRGANLLLNVGPRPDGAIGPEFTERLRPWAGGSKTNGPAVYGTRRGPIRLQPWGVSTLRDGHEGEAPAIYLHILKPDVHVDLLPEELVEFDAIPLGKTTPLEARSGERPGETGNAGRGPNTVTTRSSCCRPPAPVG